MSKKLITLILTGLLLMGMMIPTLAQDTEPITDGEAETGNPTPAPLRLTATTDLFITTQLRVNVRTGPGLEYPTLGVMVFGDSLDITGQNGGDWLQVNYGGNLGWVFRNIVEVNGLLDNAPQVDLDEAALLNSEGIPETVEAGETLPQVSGPVTMMTRYNINLRNASTTDSDILGVIPVNVELSPVGRSNDRRWIIVQYEDKVGWVYAPLLFFTRGNVATLPVMTTLPPIAPAPEATPDPEA